MPKPKTSPPTSLAADAYKWQDVIAAFDTTERIIYSLPKCRECGAVVEACDREKHYDWHLAARNALQPDPESR